MPQSTPVDIRRAVDADAQALTTIAQRAKASWDYPRDWLERWQDELTFTPADLARTTMFTACRDGIPVAMCSIEPGPDGWSLEHLWVLPEHQGSGLGRALVEHALQFARERGAESVEVISDPYAESFYRRLGAVQVGAEPAPMPGAADRVLPRLRFSGP